MIWKWSAWINRWLKHSIYLENVVVLDRERNFIVKSKYLCLLKRCKLEIFWYNNVGENIFQIIFLQYCINARLCSLELRHGMEHKRTEISYLDWSEWGREREYCVLGYSDWLWIWRRSLILQSCRDCSTGSGISTGYWGTSPERQIGRSMKLTSYLSIVPKLKGLQYMHSLCVFYIQSSLTLLYLTT
jgi:hypothetical protein